MNKPNNMPWWVYIGLIGIRARDAALQQLIVLLIGSFIAAVAGMMSGSYFLLVLFIIPLWQWAALKWADKHSVW